MDKKKPAHQGGGGWFVRSQGAPYKPPAPLRRRIIARMGKMIDLGEKDGVRFRRPEADACVDKLGGLITVSEWLSQEGLKIPAIKNNAA